MLGYSLRSIPEDEETPVQEGPRRGGVVKRRPLRNLRLHHSLPPGCFDHALHESGLGLGPKVGNFEFVSW